MIAISIVISTIYFLLILLFIVGSFKIKVFTSEARTEMSYFSIVIPFRNESENLRALLQSISKIDYPKNKFEVILVNDDSNDDSVEIIENILLDRVYLEQSLKTRCDIKMIDNIRRSNSPKKDSIETAIKNSKFDWIVTTDADCVVPINWLKIMDLFIQKESPKMIVAPVTYNLNNSLLNKFQLLDLLSLIGITIGAFGIKKPFLCNGANLCYLKKVFAEVGGFENNNNIASGDDIFLFEKIVKKYPIGVHFLKSPDAIVITNPQPNFRQLLAQRIRWASKATAYTNWFGKFVGISALSMNLWIVILFLSAIFNRSYWLIFFTTFFAKIFVDFIIISKMLFFTKQGKNIIYYPLIAVFYPLFNIFVAFLSIFKISFLWKGRRFSS
jgi:cellulose synthase/poly-beta-1,6-N-acetylglucosamine synthase-like glycosyltransferase